MSDDEADAEEVEEDESSSEEGEESSGKSGGKKKLILIIAGVVVVILIGVGGAFFMGVFDSLLGHGEPEVVEVVEIPPGPPVYHEFPQMVVDLKKTGARIHYIKIKVVAEIVTRDLPLLVAAELKITDKIQAYLRSQSRKELAGRNGTERMRSDIQKIIAIVMGPVKVEGVLFREILLQ